MGQRRDNKAKFCMYEAAELPAGRSDVASRAPTTRSRITNGKQMLAGIDGRSAEARRYRDLAMSFADDLGGAACLTEAQRALVFQAASLVVQSEALNGAMIRGELVDVEQQTRVANALGRTLNRLGIRKRVSPAPTIADYLAARKVDRD
jgi:predicted ABC-type transport system involved in lysophospholipase L1 biosynthesis ATPase subunit